jgi:hypothetical protein
VFEADDRFEAAVNVDALARGSGKLYTRALAICCLLVTAVSLGAGERSSVAQLYSATLNECCRGSCIQVPAQLKYHGAADSQRSGGTTFVLRETEIYVPAHLSLQTLHIPRLCVSILDPGFQNLSVHDGQL